MVKPATVLAWHRKGFRLFWRWKSRKRGPGRPRISAEVRKLIVEMAEMNVGWGAPRIHGELLKLGIEISEITVSRYMPKRPPPAGSRQRWATFLRNHLYEILCLSGSLRLVTGCVLSISHSGVPRRATECDSRVRF